MEYHSRSSPSSICTAILQGVFITHSVPHLSVPRLQVEMAGESEGTGEVEIRLGPNLKASRAWLYEMEDQGPLIICWLSVGLSCTLVS